MTIPIGRPFEHLARKGKFHQIEQVLICDELECDELHKWLFESCSGRDTPLHVLLRHQPPLSLVDMLAHKLAAMNATDISTSSQSRLSDESIFIPEDAVDDAGRTPLHIAAAMGCRVEVVERLLMGATYIMPVFARDQMGRLPLHWACTNPSGSNPVMFKKKNASQKASLPSTKDVDAAENLMNVVRKLVSLYPESVSIRDNSGLTPLEIARQYNGNSRVQNILKDMTKGNELGGTYSLTSGESEGIPLDFQLHISQDCRSPDNDSVSTLGHDMTPRYRGKRIVLKCVDNPCDVIVGPDNRESRSVVDRCWFI